MVLGSLRGQDKNLSNGFLKCNRWRREQDVVCLKVPALGRFENGNDNENTLHGSINFPTIGELIDNWNIMTPRALTDVTRSRY
jgi:hypothetical protein